MSEAKERAEGSPGARRRALPPEARYRVGRGLHLAYLGALALALSWGGLVLVTLMVLFMGLVTGSALSLVQGGAAYSGIYAYWPIFILIGVLTGIGRFIHDVADEYVFPYLGFVALCGFLLLTLLAGRVEVAVHLAGLVHLASWVGVVLIAVGTAHLLTLRETWLKVVAGCAITALAFATLTYSVGLVHWFLMAVQVLSTNMIDEQSLRHGSVLSLCLGITLFFFSGGLLGSAVVLRRVAQATADVALRRESMAVIAIQAVVLSMLVFTAFVPPRQDLLLGACCILLTVFIVIDLTLLVVHLNRLRWTIR